MSGFGSWKAVRPSASASTGQDPLSEAFKSAVNAFGRPDKMRNYHDGSLQNDTTNIPSAYLSRTPVDRSHPATPEQSRTAAIPTANQQSSSNVTDVTNNSCRLQDRSLLKAQTREMFIRIYWRLGRRHDQLRGNSA